MKFHKITIPSFLLIWLIMGINYQINAQDVYEGWAFYSSGTSCYLYDVDKSLVHTWESDYNCAGAARLLRDSSVLYSGRNPDGWIGGVMTGGQLQIIKWNGDVAWDFQYATSEYCIHHNLEIIYTSDDPEALSNVLVACFEKETGTDKLPDKITEIKPTGKTTGEVVWQWYAWKHKTSSPDDNVGHLDEDAGGTGGMMSDWNHVNSVSYNYDLEQIIIGAKAFGEFFILDHTTTTVEAEGSTGGKYGKGGDLLYRWGHASNYGISGSDYLDNSMRSGFHAACWVPKIFPGTNLEVPGGGNVLIFHNFTEEAVEVELPGDGDGIYPRDPGEAYGPDSPTWTCDISGAGEHEGSVQRLPNGNTFICDGRENIFEVTSGEEIVWTMEAKCNQAFKYAYSYLDPQTYIKKKNVSEQQTLAVNIYSNPVTSKVHIAFNNFKSNAKIDIFSIDGKKVLSRIVNDNDFVWDIRNQPSGVYVVNLKTEGGTFNKYFNLIK